MSYPFDLGDWLASQSINSVTQTFGYDALDQITNNNGLMITYDQSGNGQ